MPNSKTSASKTKKITPAKSIEKKGRAKKRESGKKVKFEIGSGNVFKDIGFSDNEANLLQLKCTLMFAIEKEIKANGWTQAEAARKLRVVQPRISEVVTGKLDRFTLDMLLKYLDRLGKRVELTITEFR